MPKKAMGRVLDRYEIDQLIVQTIAISPDSTIDAISKDTGLSYTAVRNSLQRLVDLGVVIETSDTKGPGRRGRPAVYFRIDQGLQLHIPPRQFQHLALTLVEQLAQEKGSEYVAGLLDRAAKLQVNHIIDVWNENNNLPKTLEQMIKRICDYINQQGCYAKHKASANGFYIQVNNCVYEAIAAAYPGTICRYHESLIINLIHYYDSSISINHEDVMAKGDHACRYIIVQP